MEDTHPLVCPLCEVHELDPYDRDSTHCPHCGLLGGVFLESLRQISALPDVIGAHAYECGHPEMRRLSDGVFHFAACGSEILPSAYRTAPNEDRAEAGFLVVRRSYPSCTGSSTITYSISASPC